MSIEQRDEITVLHVDDEPDFADLAAEYLEREDDRISVLTATSVQDGLAILAEADVDCIISDYDMPDTNGIEFLESIRDNRPDLPFILYTGKGPKKWRVKRSVPG
jgi:CheY-like chemotaxis protein